MISMKGLRLALLLVALLGFTACGGSPTSAQPGAAASRYAGTWLVDFVVETCSGNRQCVHSLGDTRQFQLRLVEDAGGLTGVFTLNGMTTTAVSGQAGANDELTLAGFTPAAFPGVVGSNSMEARLQGRLRTGSRASGTVEYAMRGVPQGDFFGDYVVRGRIVSAARLPDEGLTENSFAGTWRGWVAIRSCSFSGWTFCTPMRRDAMQPIELRLVQAGSDVTGSMTLGSTSLDVTGTASGSRLVLRGARDRVVSGGREVMTILEWSSTRDKAGLLRGVFRYQAQYLMDTGAENQTTYDLIELWSVVLF